MVVRELITLIGFRVNAGELATAERAYRRLKTQSDTLSSLGRNATVFLTLPLAMMGKHILTAANNMQLLNVSMENYTGSAEAARLKTKEIMDLALRSPLATVEDIGKTARQLLGRGLDPNSLVPVMERLLNLSGAFQAPIQNVAKAYTDVKALGTLRAQEKNQFANAGIDIVGIVGDYIGKSRGAVMEMMTKRLISFKTMDEALERFAGKGSKVASLIERIGKTPYGQWLKFKDQVLLLEAKIGQKALPTLAKLVEQLARFVGVLNNLNPNFYRFMLILGSVVALIGPMLLFKNLLVALAGPFGVVMVIAAGLAVALDDIFIWTQNGNSVMGVLFGNFDQYRESFMAVKEMAGTTLKDLLSTVKSLNTVIGELFNKFGKGEKGKTFFGWSVDSLAGIVRQVDRIVNSLRMATLYMAWILGNSEQRAKLLPELLDAQGKQLSPAGTGGFISSGVLGSIVSEKVAGFLENRASGMSWSAAAGKAPNPTFIPFAPTINVDARGAGGDPNKIADTTVKAIDRMFEEKWNVKMGQTGTSTRGGE